MRVTALRIDGKPALDRISVATHFWSRFLGLMGRAALPEGEGIFFPRCNSIHTFFMRFPIDVVFVTQTGRVELVMSALPPWRFVWPRLGASHVLELKAESAESLGIAPGVRLEGDGLFHAS
ncbi:MAG: DUF192 domain-containing protein [Deltaproteobacteria bacterium]|nr:DUF192 domain-containing protein [Deltaproteobacteria bacterium]MBI3296490.1 DUF192 domain-containing protein [Deltaproteobacteria bacterium]